VKIPSPKPFFPTINTREGFKAEWVGVGGTSLGEPCPCQRNPRPDSPNEVPYYQVYLKQASMQGTYVVNNPFWMNVDDKFFGYSLG